MITALAVLAAIYLAIGLWLLPGSYRNAAPKAAQMQGRPLTIGNKLLLAALALLLNPAAFVFVLWGELRK